MWQQMARVMWQLDSPVHFLYFLILNLFLITCLPFIHQVTCLGEVCSAYLSFLASKTMISSQTSFYHGNSISPPFWLLILQGSTRLLYWVSPLLLFLCIPCPDNLIHSKHFNHHLYVDVFHMDISSPNLCSWQRPATLSGIFYKPINSTFLLLQTTTATVSPL